MGNDFVDTRFNRNSSSKSCSSGQQDISNSLTVEAEKAVIQPESDLLYQQNSDSGEIGLNTLITVTVNTIANSLIHSPDSLTEHNVASFFSSVAELATKLKDVSKANAHGHLVNENPQHLKYPCGPSSKRVPHQDQDTNENIDVHCVKTETESSLFACERCDFRTNLEKEMIRHIQSSAGAIPIPVRRGRL
jgi:hypothetical protein